MRRQVCVVLLASIGSFIFDTNCAAQKKNDGWIDLTPGLNLQGWFRVPLPPDDKLVKTNPWKWDAKRKILVCNGVGVKEMFLFKKKFGDGVFHVEWRFVPVKGKTFDYNSGIYVRCPPNGKYWIQAQVAKTKKPPQFADLFGELPAANGPKKFVVPGKGRDLVNPIGEWNTYDILCRGKTIEVKVNGNIATRFTKCPFAEGHVGLQAEYYVIEFRNLRFKKTD